MRRIATPGLAKYVIGLSVLFVLTLGLAGWLFMQAGDVKADTKTYESAQKIATELDRYITDQNKIPMSLNIATDERVPAEVKYTKLSDERYRFCVTYKAANSQVDFGDAQSKLLMNAYGATGSALKADEESYLYVSSSHKKGENCQTIKPYLMSSLFDSSFDDKSLDMTLPSTGYDDCERPTDYNDSAAYDAYLDCVMTI
jgi:hypothetical protein